MLHSSIYCQQTKGETEQESKKIIRLFGPFAPHKSHKPNELSVGEQQRVAVARH
jgi:ABC-type lipoprotein export system ATPase subunit